MKTCVSLDCPFISYCKHYNFKVDHSNGCETREKILLAAQRELKERKRVKKV